MKAASIAAGTGALLGVAFWATFRFFAGTVSRLISFGYRWRDAKQERTTQ